LWGPVQEAETKDIKQTNQQIAKLKTLNNVIFGQSTDRREIPNIIKQFDVCMIPYDTKLASVRYSYPMKLFEYFYLGKPIVSTPIVELKNLTKYVKIGRSPQEWQDLIRSVLTPTWSKQLQAEQNKMAIANSWERKISAISLVIEQLESNK
jgi:glycosyltransferase involved in cell wall biosynthesis